jgi:polysaccharide pyruvyl transferase WcaK-like protein
VSGHQCPGVRSRTVGARPRVGLFGNLGSGNIGNDASLEAMLEYLSADQPGAILDAMCGGPKTVKDRYGIPAIPLRWLPDDMRLAAGRAAAARKSLGRVVDIIRMASWVRRHEVVIVPGMGVLETTLPLRPWQFPFDMFALCVSGRIFRTKVALVSIGANVARERSTRWLFTAAARLAFYRSYRDELSRDAMRRQGLDTGGDHVYPDLAFGLAGPLAGLDDDRTVGIGLMEYSGNEDDDRGRAAEIRAGYVEKMKAFTRWLVDDGRQVRLFIGDTNNADEAVVEEILADLRAHRPALDPARVVAEPVSTFADLRRAMAPTGTVVATRYHNVVCALMLSKPTISIGYGQKNAVLMAGSGLGEYCQSINDLDVEQLIQQFTSLETHAARLRQIVAAANTAKEPLVASQRAELSALLFPPGATRREMRRPLADRLPQSRRKTSSSAVPGGSGEKCEPSRVSPRSPMNPTAHSRGMGR